MRHCSAAAGGRSAVGHTGEMRVAAPLSALITLAATAPARADPEAADRGNDAPPPATERAWTDGAHLTGEWRGVRGALARRGIAVALRYAADAFTARGRAAIQGHVEAALTLDSRGLGLWDGATLRAAMQNNHGHGINNTVGAQQPVTRIEAAPYTELAELWLEQTALDGRLRVVIGKQDANREFGTPRLGGDFLGSNLGRHPTAPLPSSPSTGLGAIVAVRPADWLVGKLAIYEARPLPGGLGLTRAFEPGGGYTVVGGAAATHRLGGGRSGGTTSAGVWRQSGSFVEVGAAPDAAPRMFEGDHGWFVQHDERIDLDPDGDDVHRAGDDPRGLTAIVRVSGARPDRTVITHHASASIAWRGIGARRGDAIGLGASYLRIAEPLRGSRGPRDEWAVEAFYDLRWTRFVRVQPDVQAFRHPGGDGSDAIVAGVRLALEL